MLLKKSNTTVSNEKPHEKGREIRSKLLFFAIIEYERFLQSKPCPMP